MELKIKIGYKEILELIKQLPPNQILKLKSELEAKLKLEATNISDNALQNLLLSGPIMTEEQYDEFLAMRQSFNSWRT